MPCSTLKHPQALNTVMDTLTVFLNTELQRSDIQYFYLAGADLYWRCSGLKHFHYNIVVYNRPGYEIVPSSQDAFRTVFAIPCDKSQGDVSSTLIRMYLEQNNADALDMLTFHAVTQYLLQHKPHLEQLQMQ